MNYRRSKVYACCGKVTEIREVMYDKGTLKLNEIAKNCITEVNIEKFATQSQSQRDNMASIKTSNGSKFNEDQTLADTNQNISHLIDATRTRDGDLNGRSLLETNGKTVSDNRSMNPEKAVANPCKRETSDKIMYSLPPKKRKFGIEQALIAEANSSMLSTEADKHKPNKVCIVSPQPNTTRTGWEKATYVSPTLLRNNPHTIPEKQSSHIPFTLMQSGLASQQAQAQLTAGSAYRHAPEAVSKIQNISNRVCLRDLLKTCTNEKQTSRTVEQKLSLQKGSRERNSNEIVSKFKNDIECGKEHVETDHKLTTRPTPATSFMPSADEVKPPNKLPSVIEKYDTSENVTKRSKANKNSQKQLQEAKKIEEKLPTSSSSILQLLNSELQRNSETAEQHQYVATNRRKHPVSSNSAYMVEQVHESTFRMEQQNCQTELNSPSTQRFHTDNVPHGASIHSNHTVINKSMPVTTHQEPAQSVSPISNVQEPAAPTGIRNVDPQTNLRMLSECRKALEADEDGDLPLHIAVVQEIAPMIIKLIEMMTFSKVHVDSYNHMRQTPVHLAVITDQPGVVSILLKAGASPNLPDRHGESCFHLAARLPAVTVMSVLLTQYNKGELNKRSHEGVTPMHIAAENTNPELVKILAKHGAEVNVPDGKSGSSPLIHAVQSDNPDTVQQLLLSGANQHLQNYAGVVPTMIAISKGYINSLHMLTKFGESDVKLSEEPKIYSGAPSKQAIGKLYEKLVKRRVIAEADKNAVPSSNNVSQVEWGRKRKNVDHNENSISCVPNTFQLNGGNVATSDSNMHHNSPHFKMPTSHDGFLRYPGNTPGTKPDFTSTHLPRIPVPSRGTPGSNNGGKPTYLESISSLNAFKPPPGTNVQELLLPQMRLQVNVTNTAQTIERQDSMPQLEPQQLTPQCILEHDYIREPDMPNLVPSDVMAANILLELGGLRHQSVVEKPEDNNYKQFETTERHIEKSDQNQNIDFNRGECDKTIGNVIVAKDSEKVTCDITTEMNDSNKSHNICEEELLSNVDTKSSCVSPLPNIIGLDGNQINDLENVDSKNNSICSEALGEIHKIVGKELNGNLQSESLLKDQCPSKANGDSEFVALHADSMYDHIKMRHSNSETIKEELKSGDGVQSNHVSKTIHSDGNVSSAMQTSNSEEKIEKTVYANNQTMYDQVKMRKDNAKTGNDITVAKVVEHGATEVNMVLPDCTDLKTIDKFSKESEHDIKIYAVEFTNKKCSMSACDKHNPKEFSMDIFPSPAKVLKLQMGRCDSASVVQVEKDHTPYNNQSNSGARKGIFEILKSGSGDEAFSQVSEN